MQTTTWNLTCTSPSSAITAVGARVTLGPIHSLQIFATLQGATGGTLDVYLQIKYKFNPTTYQQGIGVVNDPSIWVDYAHFSQLASAASPVHTVWSVSKSGQQLTATTVGQDLSPALTAGTIVGGEFGDEMRVVFTAGAGTSVGTSQQILLVGTS